MRLECHSDAGGRKSVVPAKFFAKRTADERSQKCA